MNVAPEKRKWPPRDKLPDDWPCWHEGGSSARTPASFDVLASLSVSRFINFHGRHNRPHEGIIWPHKGERKTGGGGRRGNECTG